VLDRLFEAGQADLTKLMQARQRLIQLQNAQLDAVWQATQAQADLLIALGIPSLIHAMLNRAENGAASKPSDTPPAQDHVSNSPPISKPPVTSSRAVSTIRP
jgi:outer membrane protein, heavy metal efflux system